MESSSAVQMSSTSPSTSVARTSYGDQTQPSLDFGEGLSRQAGVSSTPNDYFAAPSGRSDPFDHVDQPSAHPQGQAHPWSNLFSGPGTSSGAQLVADTPLQHPSHAKQSLSIPLSGGSSEQLAFTPRQVPTMMAFPRSMQRAKSNGSTSSAFTSTSTLTADELAKFQAIQPADLMDLLLSASSSSDREALEGTLVIDIRPSTSYALARIRGSINVCAPSTLLKRSGVTIERIEEEMLGSEQDQIRFSGWRKGPRRAEDGNSSSSTKVPDDVSAVHRIVVLDTDTRNVGDAGKPASGGGGPCLTGMLRKFDLAGFAGQLFWLVGGFNAFAHRVASTLKTGEEAKGEQTLVEWNNPATSLKRAELKHDQDTKAEDAANGFDSSRRSSAPSFKPLLGSASGLKLPPATIRANSLVHPKWLPMEAFSSSSTTRGKSYVEDAVTDSTAGSEAGQGGGSSLSAANPFFDNIRQNKELQNGITERIPLTVPEMSEGEARRLPGFLAKLRRKDADERASSLAQSFFEIEQQERDRLMATMQRHVNESDCKAQSKRESLSANAFNLSSEYSAVSPGEDCKPADKASFPFSIAAALERGGENRYNNIWTYEHSRVRCPKSADYLNGSYVEPARQYGCHRRYIATQAPLPSTFDTFWSVVWQQNVRTICMVTREFESGRVQSHNYWSQKQYGPYDLEVIEEIVLDNEGNTVKQLKQQSSEGQSYFGLGPQPNDADSYPTIRRRLRLSGPDGEQRIITQFQYIGWPDYSVPEDADGLLVLMRLAATAQQSADNASRLKNGKRAGPMVVHCSAGVGRTGTYIVIDAVLDVIRRARYASAGRPMLDVWDQGWVDSPERGREPKQSPVLKGGLAVPEGTQRKNLKRELSPSAMDLDSRDGRRSTSPTHDGELASSGRDIDSPPPARRSRSDEAEEALKSAVQASHLPFSVMGSDGPQTPSTALGRLSLASASSTPGRSRTESQPSVTSSSLESGSALNIDEDGSDPYPSTLPSDIMDPEGVDLVRKVVDTIREQRMSMVQTTRQYVFAYWAIFNGVLQEMRREEAALERRLSS